VSPIARDLLERHPCDRPVVVLVGVGQRVLDHAAAGTVAPVERQTNVADLV